MPQFPIIQTLWSANFNRIPKGAFGVAKDRQIKGIGSSFLLAFLHEPIVHALCFAAFAFFVLPCTFWWLKLRFNLINDVPDEAFQVSSWFFCALCVFVYCIVAFRMLRRIAQGYILPNYIEAIGDSSENGKGSSFKVQDHLKPMQGMVCVVTGANSGIGFEIAKQLALWGAARVILLSRNSKEGMDARDRINSLICNIKAAENAAKGSSSSSCSSSSSSCSLSLSSSTVQPFEENSNLIHRRKSGNDGETALNNNSDGNSNNHNHHNSQNHNHSISANNNSSSNNSSNSNNAPQEPVEWVHLDLCNEESIHQCAERILKSSNGRIDRLINNAGLMAPNSLMMANEKYEIQFQTHVIGHYLLTKRLLEAIVMAHGRVINVSSIAHYFGASSFRPVEAVCEEKAFQEFSNQVVSTEYESEKRVFPHFLESYNYNKNQSYGNSKLAMLWMTANIQKELHALESAYLSSHKQNENQVSKYSICLSTHPGCIHTNLSRHAIGNSNFKRHLFNFFANTILKSTQVGAATPLMLCIEDTEKLLPGGYYAEGELGCVRECAYDIEKQMELERLFNTHIR